MNDTFKRLDAFMGEQDFTEIGGGFALYRRTATDTDTITGDITNIRSISIDLGETSICFFDEDDAEQAGWQYPDDLESPDSLIAKAKGI